MYTICYLIVMAILLVYLLKFQEKNLGKSLIYIIICNLTFFGIVIINIKPAHKREKESKTDKSLVKEKANQVIDSIKQEAALAKKEDSLAIIKLKPFFNEKKDEFSTEALIFIKPKNAPSYVNYNTFYLYFAKSNTALSQLRFRIQFINNDWVFLKKIVFLIDDQPYEFYPSKVDTDVMNGGQIVEWVDEAIDEYSATLIAVLSQAKKVKVKFIGNQYYEIRTMSAKDLQYIKHSYNYYKALGGSI